MMHYVLSYIIKNKKEIIYIYIYIDTPTPRKLTLGKH
jgi:hypothetical protein